jgi:multidrug efflux pump subunit AcrB
MKAFTRFFVERWQFTLVLFTLLVALGLNAIAAIPKSEDPLAKFPIIFTTVILPGADAEEMERLVAIPLEEAVSRVEDLAEVESTNVAGVTTVQAEFTWGVDPDRKYDEVVREVNRVLPTLPSGVREVRIDRGQTSNANVVQLALVGSESTTLGQLRAAAVALQEVVERQPGVQTSELWGLPDAQVRVTLNLAALAQYYLPAGAVVQALSAASDETPVGALEAGGRRFNVQAGGAFTSLEAVRAVPLRSGDGQTLTVGDVAEVAWQDDEERHVTRYNGERAVFVTARAALGENVFAITDAIHAAAEDFRAQLPEGVRLELGFDQSETVFKRLSKLGRDFLIAIFLVLLTLIPLGFRASLVVMMSIPLSLAMGVTALHFLGYSLNQLSIAGFIIALGLLVDDSIVVTENIARRLREGLPPRQAAVAGVDEINIAVLGCTATLLLAFLPLLALPEGSGEFIRSLPMAVIMTISASLFVALTVIPFLASRLLNPKDTGHSNPALDVVMGGIHRVYSPILHLALSRPLATVAVGLAAFALSLTLIPRLGFSLFPENDSPYFMVDVTLPEGAALEVTDETVRFVDGVLAEYPEVVWRMANTGRGNPFVYYNDSPAPQLSNVGSLYVSLDGWEPDVHRPILADIRERLDAYPGAQITVRRFENGPPIEAPIAVRIQGPDIATLEALAADAERLINETPGVRDVRNPLAARLVDLDLGVNAEQAALLGVQAGGVEQAARIAIGGAPAGNFQDLRGDTYPVIVRSPTAPSDAPALDSLNRLYVWTAAGGAMPLSNVTAPSFTSGPAQIDRYQRERSVTITAFAAEGYLTSAVTEDAVSRLQTLSLPPGYSLSLGGQAEASADSFSGLGTAILVAIFGILAVLLLEFRTFAVTAVVAFVIPFGVMGGLIALWIAGESLSFTAVIGFVALIGIEIKNSILLVEFANQERARGMPLREAVEKAGEVRFLPVLLTSVTAIGGLTPLVLENSPLFSPLAIVIIGGLVSSTLVARIVTPAMYLILAPKDEPAEEAVQAA